MGPSKALFILFIYKKLFFKSLAYWIVNLKLTRSQDLLIKKTSNLLLNGSLKDFRRISKDSNKASIKYFLNFQTLYNTTYFVYTYIYKYNRVHINTITLMYPENYWVDVVHSSPFFFFFLNFIYVYIYLFIYLWEYIFVLVIKRTWFKCFIFIFGLSKIKETNNYLQFDLSQWKSNSSL